MAREILVTGGAGYIGAHVNRLLSESGYRTIVLDNLSRSSGRALLWGEHINGDIRDRDLLDTLFSTRDIAAVIHLASLIDINESMRSPDLYHSINTSGTRTLLDAMAANRIDRFLFSSSCAVYGVPEQLPLAETHPCQPINPYGLSKLAAEEAVCAISRTSNIRYAIFRFFNTTGCSRDALIGESHNPETHLIPRVFSAALHNTPIAVYGTDYETPDGSCIRDYVHVLDIAGAHKLALENLLSGGDSGIYNLGNNQGFSVREIIRHASRVSGRPIEIRETEKRPGDAAMLVGDAGKIRRELG